MNFSPGSNVYLPNCIKNVSLWSFKYHFIVKKNANNARVFGNLLFYQNFIVLSKYCLRGYGEKFSAKLTRNLEQAAVTEGPGQELVSPRHSTSLGDLRDIIDLFRSGNFSSYIKIIKCMIWKSWAYGSLGLMEVLKINGQEN